MSLCDKEGKRGNIVGRGAAYYGSEDHQRALRQRIEAHVSECELCDGGIWSLRDGGDSGGKFQGCDWYHALVGELNTISGEGKMNEPDGNTAAERRHNDGYTDSEEKEFREECCMVVKEFMANQDGLIEMFEFLPTEVKYRLLRTMLLNQHTKDDFIYYAKEIEWVKDDATERIISRKDDLKDGNV